MSDIAVAALLASTILVASMVSIEIGLSVALIELAGGFIVGNALSLDVPSWLSFIGSFAGVVLTFLAGAEVDVPQFRREWKASLSIGLVSFFAPFAVVGLLCCYALGWNHRQAEIGGLALSTTSLAVVYARSSSFSQFSSSWRGSATGRTRRPCSPHSSSASR